MIIRELALRVPSAQCTIRGVSGRSIGFHRGFRVHHCLESVLCFVLVSIYRTRIFREVYLEGSVQGFDSCFGGFYKEKGAVRLKRLDSESVL